MILHLFGQGKQGQTWREEVGPGAVVLRGFAVPDATAIFPALHGITTQAPFRHAVSGRLGCHQLEVGKP
jgi:DNA oxidative demethylase